MGESYFNKSNILLQKIFVKTLSFVLLIFTFLLLYACSPSNVIQKETNHINVYEGPDKEKSSIAIISTERQKRFEVEIQTVDGRKLGNKKFEPHPSLIHLLPGLHVIEVQMGSNDFERVFRNQLTLEARAGHEYIIKFKRWIDSRLYDQFPDFPHIDVRFWIEDLKTGEVVSYGTQI